MTNVSVIVAAFNAEKTIENALISLEKQVCDGSVEIVVANDGSTDSTGHILGRWLERGVIVVDLPMNVGRAAARHAAIQKASGRILVVADADDEALPHRVQAHVDALAAAPGSVATGGQIEEILPSGEKFSGLRFPVVTEQVDASFERGRMALAHPASAFTREWYDSVGGYDPQIRWCEDYDLFARGWAERAFAPIAEPLVRYRRSSRRTSWGYWWENERHLRAINQRIQENGRAGAGGADFAPYLAEASTNARRFVELGRYWVIQLRDGIRRARN